MKYLKKFNESQIFDFNTKKGELLNFIQKVKNGEKPNNYRLFYDITTKAKISDFENLWQGTNNTEDYNKLNDDWKLKFDSGIKTGTLLLWDGWVGYMKRIKDENEENTYNFYVTLLKTEKNIRNFINNIQKLNKSLKELSNTEQKSILWKTKYELYDFMTHNDSYKVYWFDNSIKDKIVNIIKTWAKDNNIILSDRTHNYGADIKTKDVSLSFGEILGYLIEKRFVKVILKYPNNKIDYYYDWLEKNFKGIISEIYQKRKKGILSTENIINYIKNYPNSLYNGVWFPKK